MAEPIEEAEGTGPDSTPSVSDGLAAALIAALRRMGHGAGADPEFDGFLKEQADLVRLQKEHLHEQRTLILSRLRWGRYSDRMKALLQTLTALLALAVVAAVAVMAWQAHEDHGVAIQAFSMPPDFAQRGLTGQVVAGQLLDRLSDLQARTATGRPASTYANDWGDDIKVEIPETGVSIGELNRWLRQWLGSETRITGAVVRTQSGVAVTVRAGDVPGRRVEGTEADVDKLIDQAAEAIYAETQPYRYAVYLQSQGKIDQALQAYAGLAGDATAAPKERGWGYFGWAGLLLERNTPRGALDKVSEAIRLDPWIAPAGAVRQTAYRELGRPEDALAADRAGLRVLESGRGEGVASVDQARATRGEIRDVIIPALFGDYAQALAASERQSGRLNFEGGGGYSLRSEIVGELISVHDVSGAMRQSPAGSPARWDVHIAAAEALDDWPAALSAIDRQVAQVQAWPLTQAHRADILARLGRIAEAQVAIAPTPLDCTDCLVARGGIAALAGDRRDADRWLGEAARRAQLPDEYLDWGRALLTLGDPGAAIVELKQAHKLGPHYADPLEVWGEALMAKRDYTGAIKKFAAADEDAPKWGRNHLRWGEALMLSGRYAEARAQYQIANGLDLSKPDRAALNVLLARTTKGPLHG